MSFLKNNLIGIEGDSNGGGEKQNDRDREKKINDLIKKGENALSGSRSANQFCGHCGDKIEKNAKFCSSCVEKVVTEFHESEKKETHDSISKKNEYANSDIHPASQGKRLLNMLLDYFFFLYIFAFFVGLLLASLGMYDVVDSANETVFGLIMGLVYYLFFEGIWHKTPAKFLTRTKVVMQDGSAPRFSTIIIRTLVRFIPLESFSFLGGKFPVGWHDNFSKTFVVSSKYNEEDLKNINLEKPVDEVKSKTKNIVLIIAIVFIILMIIGALSE
ncbi:MAG: RDD family protein [Patescibacteria group bacterium]